MLEKPGPTDSHHGGLIGDTDIVIAGAGLAGSLAALVLARRGMRVVVIDRHAVYPREFRCEKLSPAQMALMQELGVLDCLSGVTRRFDRILVVRGGRTARMLRQEERGLAYADMVNRIRATWPAEVTFHEGGVADVTTSPQHQLVALTDGRRIETRLVVFGDRPRDKLYEALGLKRQMIPRGHSFCIGFGVAAANGRSFPFESMTYFGEHAGDRMGYATFFPTQKGMRVNLFSYHDKHDAWLHAFRKDPIGKLREAMPGIGQILGDYRVIKPVEIRLIDLYETKGCERDGIVLIGDAFRSSCPATGSGVTQILTDIRQLCLIHLPRWFASPGMEAGKIGSFYGDPVKRRFEARSSRAATRARSLAVETGLRWRIERGLISLASRFFYVRGLAAHCLRRLKQAISI